MNFRYRTLAAFLVFQLSCAVALAQQTPATKLITDPADMAADIAKPLVNDTGSTESLGAWHNTFKKRLAENKRFAAKLSMLDAIKDKQKFAGQVSDLASQLPVESHFRRRLGDIATRLNSETDQKEILSLDNAKAYIKRLASEMAFEPKFETALPEGFAVPTPVGEVDIKVYPPYRMARSNAGESEAFFKLFNHIKKNDIEMTSPVQMSYDRSKGKFDQTSMAFLYPDLQTEGKSNSSDVKIVETEPTSVISMGYRGRPTAEAIETAVESLRKASLRFASKFELGTSVRVLGYNGPSVPAEDQFYEIQLELLTKEDLKDSNIR